MMRPAAAFALNFSRGDDQLVAHRVLHAQVERELDRLLQPVGGEARHVQRRRARWPSSHFSMPAMPWLSMLTWPIDVRDHGAVRIDALVLGQEADARQAEAVDLLLLLAA